VEIQSAAEEAFISGQDEQAAVVMQPTAGRALALRQGRCVAKELDPALTVLEQFTGISTRARNYLKQVILMLPASKQT